jgi:hypothetical protein
MKRFFVSVVFFCIGVTSGFADAQNATHLSGKLIKKYYPAPSIVKNPAFGWYLELNKLSQKVIQKKFQQLSKEDQHLFKSLDIDLLSVQCVDCTDDFLLQARVLNGTFVSMEGKLGTPYLARKYLCFSIEPNAISSRATGNNVESHSNLDKFDHLSKYFYIDNELSNETENEPFLQLPEDTPEKLVVLKGKLILRLFPGPPEYTSIEKGDRADYCWMLLLNAESFRIATSTPVGEPYSDLKSILNWSNHNEVHLGLEEDMNDFCCGHEDKEVTAQGYLFHAHTAHHYSPILMDVKKLLD